MPAQHYHAAITKSSTFAASKAFLLIKVIVGDTLLTYDIILPKKVSDNIQNSN